MLRLIVQLLSEFTVDSEAIVSGLDAFVAAVRNSNLRIARLLKLDLQVLIEILLHTTAWLLGRDAHIGRLFLSSGSRSRILLILIRLMLSSDLEKQE